MATKCCWCGRRIGFTDMTYTYEKVGNNVYCVCGECSGRVSSAKSGNITFEEIKTERTVPELFDYLAGQVKTTDEMIQSRRLREEQQIKDDARHTNPLYDDIHQIAQDLRFIKNYLIFSIVIGVIFASIYLVTMLG